MREQTEAKTTVPQFFSDVWWLDLFRAIALTVLGWLLLTRPAITTLIVRLVQFLGAYWFVDGIFTITASVKWRQVDKDWGWGIFVGVLGILAGVAVFLRLIIGSLFTQRFLVYTVASMMLVSGVASIIRGIRLHQKICTEWTIILGGILSIIFGMLLLIYEYVSSIALVWLTGICALMAGIMMIVFSFRLQKLSKDAAVAEK